MEGGTVTSASSAIDSRAQGVREVVHQHAAERGPLLLVLHGVMERYGHITLEDIAVVAQELNYSVADVHGVVSFYSDFRSQPPPRHTVQLCRAEACQAVGAQALYAAARESLGSRDGVEVSEVFCLGNCALGPSGMVDGRLHGRLDLDRLDALTAAWEDQ